MTFESLSSKAFKDFEANVEVEVEVEGDEAEVEGDEKEEDEEAEFNLEVEVEVGADALRGQGDVFCALVVKASKSSPDALRDF